MAGPQPFIGLLETRRRMRVVGLVQAQFQFEQVQASIAANQAEIADHESLFTQFKDYVGGMQSAVSGVPGDAKSEIGSGAKTGGGFEGAEAAFVAAYRRARMVVPSPRNSRIAAASYAYATGSIGPPSGGPCL